MKRWLKLLFLLVVVLISTFTFTDSSSSLTASATYVEGNITQDSIWTLIDSPFVVSRDITVNSNVRLTIEPGVEVRFGGNFSITVFGTLQAYGIQNKIITFTSNKDQPQSGDWNEIKFRGTELSVLTYCSIRYAKNGTTIENGNVAITNSEIVNNLQNGISIKNSIAVIQNNVISDNSQNGITITGDNQVTIQNNTIRSNADGILLTGNLTSSVSISQNIVLSNVQSGIKLSTESADYQNDIIILENILSANNYGFYVSGNASTYIMHNYISYNNSTGISYQNGNNHVAHFNDIYGNGRGMDVSSGANVTVNAEYNYWGDESGPFHISLNPAGKGNAVGGDGKNLDFIFFLTAPIGYINERPTARLLTDRTLVSPNQPNQTVMFIATTSSDDRHVDQYFMDFGDGNTSGWTTVSIFVHSYSSVGNYQASLMVMDDFAVTSSNSAVTTINVQDLTPLEVSIAVPANPVSSGEHVSITAHVRDGTSPVVNSNVTLFSVEGGIFASSSGLTNSTGHFTTTFTTPNATEINEIAIFVKASKSGYTEGSDHKYLKVLPTLSVQVTIDPAMVESEETSTVTVLVTDNEQPVAGASVALSSESGNFSATTGTTGSEGNATFVFSAPLTTTLLNITINVSATKTGYIDGQGQTTLTVEPKMLAVEVTVEPTIITSESLSQVIVHVTHEETPVSNVTVNVLSDGGGKFSVTTGTTDSKGNAVFAFTAPQVNDQLDLTITANVTKSGYVSGEDQAVVSIAPEPAPEIVGGLPLTTILLILIPIVVVAVVLILIKLEIISISLK